MRLKTLLVKMFVGGEWSIAYRKIDHQGENLPSNAGPHCYAVIPNTQEYWYGDPFLYADKSNTYIFCEAFERKRHKGSIAAAEFNGEQPGEFRIIIDQKYHMSYPCVFNYGDTYFMIPETNENRTIELYRAITFPFEWVLESVLLSDVECVDSTVLVQNSHVRVFSYTKIDKTHYLNIYKLDMNRKKLSLQKAIKYDKNVGRPAGNFLKINNKLIRPSQDSHSKYGERIIFNEVYSIDEENYAEKEMSYLKVEDVRIANTNTADRIHTINRLNNIEVIDVLKEEIDLFRAVNILIQRLKIHIKQRCRKCN